MQRSEPQVADLLCLQDNEVNHGRDPLVATPETDGGEIYEPLWERQTSDPNQNGVTPPINGAQEQQAQQDVPPPVPRRTASGRGVSSSSIRTRTHPLATNQPQPSGMLPPSYSESEANSNLASPAYSAGQGQMNNNNINSSGHSATNHHPLARAQNVALPAQPGSSGNVSPLDYSGSHFGGASGSPLAGATASSFPLSPSGSGPGQYSVGAGAVPLSPTGALPAKMLEAMGLSDGQDDDLVCGWNAPPLDDQGAPPPYMPRSMSKLGPQVSLKERQVEALKKEMEHAGGVKVILRKLDCHHTIAWVECFGGVWIAGWNQKARPFLHNAFHVGDQIISINGQVIEGARMAHKLIKHSDDTAKITFILRRVPNARVFLLKRSQDGESIGILREGGTGEILELEPFGVAANHGMPVRAPTQDRHALCNWFITEVNMRPVSLFFKGEEIEKRLNAVGKEISILIQPGDFINEIKRLVKKNFKNYKDFVVQ